MYAAFFNRKPGFPAWFLAMLSENLLTVSAHGADPMQIKGRWELYLLAWYKSWSQKALSTFHPTPMPLVWESGQKGVSVSALTDQATTWKQKISWFCDFFCPSVTYLGGQVTLSEDWILQRVNTSTAVCRLIRGMTISLADKGTCWAFN